MFFHTPVFLQSTSPCQTLELWNAGWPPPSCAVPFLGRSLWSVLIGPSGPPAPSLWDWPQYEPGVPALAPSQCQRSAGDITRSLCKLLSICCTKFSLLEIQVKLSWCHIHQVNVQLVNIYYMCTSLKVHEQLLFQWMLSNTSDKPWSAHKPWHYLHKAAPTLACFSMNCLKSSSLSAELSTFLYRGSVSSLSFTLLHRWPPSMCCSLRRSKKSCLTLKKKTNTSNFIINLCKNNVSSRDATLESLRLRKKDGALWGVSESYLLSPRLGVLFFSLPHSGDEFHKDSLPVFHLLYGLKSGISAMLHCKFTKCCPAKKQQCWLLGSKTTRYKDI